MAERRRLDRTCSIEHCGLRRGARKSSARTYGNELSRGCPLRPGFSLRCGTLSRDSQAHACCVLRIMSACTNLSTTLSARRCTQVAPSHRGTPGGVGGLAVTASNRASRVPRRIRGLSPARLQRRPAALSCTRRAAPKGEPARRSLQPAARPRLRTSDPGACTASPRSLEARNHALRPQPLLARAHADARVLWL